MYYLNTLGLLLAFLPFSLCFCQQIDKSIQAVPPKAKITFSQPVGGPCEYSFYDTAGNCVKTLGDRQFEYRNPVFLLDLPKPPDSLKREMYFDYLVDYSAAEKKVVPKKCEKKIISALMSLKKYGLVVKNPEKATVVTGSPFEHIPFITKPSAKYLTKVENASVLDEYAEETQDVSNALLDCSYISIYNYMGTFIKGILIPDKIVDYAVVSDDGKYMACICSYSLVWDEGLTDKPEGVYVVNLASNEMTYIVIPETHGYIEQSSILFADHFFQMSYGNPWAGDSVDRLFINPYNKSFYLKHYAMDYKKSRKAIQAASFMQFEGMKERIEDFKAYSY